MSKEVSTLTVSTNGLGLSENEKDRRLQNALKLFHHGNLKEWQAIVMKSAAIWEIKTRKLSDTAAETLVESERSRQRYQLIGQRMFEMTVETAKAADREFDPLAFEFTQKVISETFEGFFTNGHAITVSGLSKASGNLETFKAYLRGEIDGDARGMKLLESSHVVSESRLESKSSDLSSMTDKEREKDFHERMRKVAEEHGLRWDRKNCRFVQVDGSPLTEEQQAELILPTSAMKLWKDLYREVRMTTTRIAQIAKDEFTQYDLFSRIPNEKFRQSVTEISGAIDQQIENLRLIKDALLAGEIGRVKEIAKNAD